MVRLKHPNKILEFLLAACWRRVNQVEIPNEHGA